MMSREESDKLVNNSGGGLARLREIMVRLRDPNDGCPWDLEQNFASLAPYAIEEAYEVADAVEREAWDDLKSELGDLLFQTIFQTQIAEEKGLFDLGDVIRAISDKMVSRHPHVFGSESRDKTAAQQAADWEDMKERERGRLRTLDGVTMGIPALSRAVKLQSRAARVGFDWPSTDLVLGKLVEEVDELVAAKNSADSDEIADEFGDLLFVMANLARHMDTDPEAALRRANAKFMRRFSRIEDWLAETGRTPQQSDLSEMDMLWDRAKLEEKAIDCAKK